MTDELNSTFHPQPSAETVKEASTSLRFGETVELDEYTMPLGDHLPPQEPRRRGKLLRSRAKRSIPKSSKKHFVGELVFNRGEYRQRLASPACTNTMLLSVLSIVLIFWISRNSWRHCPSFCPTARNRSISSISG